MILSWLCVNIIASVMIPPGYQCAEISCVSIAGGIVTMEKKLEAEKVDREKERANYEAQLAEKRANYEAQLAEKENQRLSALGADAWFLSAKHSGAVFLI